MIEIRELVAISRQSPTEANIEALWRAVFLSRAWYLLPARPADPASYPLVVMRDDEPWLVAFTNFRRLRDLERSLGHNGDSKMLMLDPSEALSQISAVKDHIRGVIFNIESDEMFRCETAALIAYAAHFGLEVD